MPFPDLSGLPPLVQAGFYAAMAIGFLIAGALIRLGFVNGKKAQPEPKAEVAAVIVDPTALNRLSDAIDGNTGVHGRMADEMSKLREELRVFREVAASKR